MKSNKKIRKAFTTGLLLVWVLFGTHEIVFAAAPSVLSRTAMSFSPASSVYDPSTNSIWATDSGDIMASGPGHLTKIRASDGVKLATYNVGMGANGVTFDPTSNSVWVATLGPGPSSAGYVTKVRASDGFILGNYPTGSQSAAGITFDPSTNSVWVTDAATYVHNVKKVRASDGVVLGTYDTQGIYPKYIIFDPSTNSIWISNSGGSGMTPVGNVVKFRASDGAFLGKYDIGYGSEGLAFDPSTNSVWVANGLTNTIKKLRASDMAVLGSYPTGAGASGVTFDPNDNSLWLVHYWNDSLKKYRASDGVLLGTYTLGLNWNFASPTFDPSTNSIWVNTAYSAWFSPTGSDSVAKVGTGTVPLQPDLTAGVVPVVSATAGTPVSFTSTISNIGTGATGAGFSNFFQVKDPLNNITDLTSTAMSALASGGVAVATSPSYSFPSGGTYYVRACADKTSSAGGGVISEPAASPLGEFNNCSASWTTISVAPANATPTVTTPTATTFTTTGATLGANVTSLGVPATITARGTCWGTAVNPTTNCTPATGLTTGVFTHARTGMTAGTTYHYRGYATNSTGTGYSPDATFTTVTPTYSITTSATAGGSVSPASASVAQGGNQTFTITANAGYSTDAVSVDGTPQGAISSYTFSNVQANHALSALFSPLTYTITATAGVGGTISPSGSVTANKGSNKTFTITPSAGYAVASVTVDGVDMGALSIYTISNVQAAHTINATFTPSVSRPKYQQF